METGEMMLADTLLRPAVSLAEPDIEREDRSDGSFVLRSRQPLKPYARSLGTWLEHWAEATPDTVFVAERQTQDGRRMWREVTYAQARDSARRIAQSLLDHGASLDRPVVALSDNSVNLALLSLAAVYVGIPITIVSSAYSRATTDYSKLSAILARLQPGLLYAEEAAAYAGAIEAFAPTCPVVFSQGQHHGSLSFDQLRVRRAGPAVDAAHAAVGPDTVAKLLLTSGSTGDPKLVINTHGMLCANQQMIAQCWTFVDQGRPVVLDWLPWSHTFGANHNFNLVLRNGGSLYLDDGRPAPGLVARTIENIRDVRPTMFFNVPRGYDVMLPLLEADEGAAADFFSRLDLLFYAGAALPQSTADRLKSLAQRHDAGGLFFTSEWGSTETSPVVTSAHFFTDDSRNIGVPAPGIELKFVPNQEKFELRVRGPSVFPAYRGDAAKTAEAFDEEGFYCMGDAGKLADPANPNRGVIFDGRVAEDFKLSTGTWVCVGTLRLRVITAMTPLVQDVVITGQDRDEVGVLIFASPAMHALAGDPGQQFCGAQLAAHPRVRETLGRALTSLCAGMGSSQSPQRAWILSSPASLGEGEITDKGYLNQRRILQLRAGEVERLYSDHEAVIRRVG